MEDDGQPLLGRGFNIRQRAKRNLLSVLIEFEVGFRQISGRFSVFQGDDIEDKSSRGNGVFLRRGRDFGGRSDGRMADQNEKPDDTENVFSHRLDPFPAIRPILGIFGSRGPFLDERERRRTPSFLNHNSLGMMMSIAA
jgi:hypothetical protein